MKYYFIAGEASGDLHGSNLVRELHKLDHNADIRCWGGDMMAEAGATLVKHYRELAFMGFAEVVGNLRTILRNISFCKKDIAAFHPDVVVFIDYPGFNLRMSAWAKEAGFRTVFYISPQVWAWKEGRVREMKKTIDRMLCILPFEKEYYRDKWNWDVDYVGHPLVRVIDEFRGKHGPEQEEHPIIALLPGSRAQEISRKLPVMLQASTAFPGYNFIVAKAPGTEDAFYEPFLSPYPNVGSVRGHTYSLLSRARAALVTSGTATLETALFGVPEVVCYKGSRISYEIAKRLIKVPFISLVNLIMGRKIVPELIQDGLTPANLVQELKKLLDDPIARTALTQDYTSLRSLLSKGGDASANAAKAIVDFAAG